MSSVECLREFVNERLTSAAEEIFTVFIKTIVEYEEEIDRQRRLLDIVWKPEIKLHRIELPQQHGSKEAEVLAQQQLCNQERNFSVDQEDPEPPQIKDELSHGGEQHVLNQKTVTFMVIPTYTSIGSELPQQHVCKREEVLTQQKLCLQERNSSLDQEDPEPRQIKDKQEELCISQEGEQLVLKQETDTFMLTPTYEESDHNEPEPNTDHCKDQTLCLKIDKILSEAEEEPVVNIPVKNYVLPEPNTDHQLLSDNSDVAESQDQKEDKHGDAGSSRDTVPEAENSKGDSKNLSNSAKKTKKSFICKTCGKDLKFKSKLKIHLKSHRNKHGDSGSTEDARPKPRKSKSCSNNIQNTDLSEIKNKAKAGKMSHKCDTCGKDFQCHSKLQRHLSIHKVKRPDSYQQLSNNSDVAESEDQKGDKHGDAGSSRDAVPEAEKSKGQSNHLNNSAKKTKKSFTCNTCGKDFKSKLQRHLKSHRDKHGDSGSTEDARPKPRKRKSCSNSIQNTNLSEIKNKAKAGKMSHKCDPCKKDFQCRSKLQKHLSVQKDERPYSCDTCGKSFSQFSKLTAHARKHTGEGPFLCKLCGKGLCTKSVLKRHIRIHTGEKLYICKTCCKAFSDSSMIKHRKIHTGEKPYSCDTCGKRFSRTSLLKTHLRTHTGEKWDIR